MPEFRVSCDGAAPNGPASFLALTVQTDGEDYHSRVLSVENLDEPSRLSRIEVYYRHSWLQCIWISPEGQLFVGDEEGIVIHRENDEWIERQLPTDRPITCIWGNERMVFAAGDSGVVFEWNGTEWTNASGQLGAKLFAGSVAPDGTVYVCGQNGNLWFRRNEAWEFVDLPTNIRLTGVCAVTNEDVLVCGTDGVLFRGAHGEWAFKDVTDVDLHGVCAFRGEIYLAGSTDGIYRLEGDELNLVKDTVISYGVVSDRDALVSFGDKIAIQFNGERWSGARFD